MASPQFDKAFKMVTKLGDILSEYTDPSKIGELRAMTDSKALPPPEGTSVTPVDAAGVAAEWVRAPGADPDSRLLYLHGGGYVMGSLNTHRDMVARISAATGCSMLFLAYRMAPEDPFPAAVDDGLAGLRWMRDNGPVGPKPAAQTFIAGDSAGGGLALATLLAARDAGVPMPDGAVTLSAWADLAGTGESMESRRDADPMIRADHLLANAAMYLKGADARNPLASPLYADLRGLPPLLMQAGDAELILDDTTRVADKAKAAGVDVTMEIWPEMFHVWQQFAGMVPEGQQAIDRIGEWVKARVAV